MSAITDVRDKARPEVYAAFLGDDPEWRIAGPLARFDPRAILRELGTPVLVVSGRYDRIATPRVAQELQRVFAPVMPRSKSSKTSAIGSGSKKAMPISRRSAIFSRAVPAPHPRPHIDPRIASVSARARQALPGIFSSTTQETT